jgi:hypothetical protein
MKEYIFTKENQALWAHKIDAVSKLIKELSIECKQDFIVTIDKYSPKRSGKQLRAYWRLINVVRKFMQEEGNNYTQEEVSNFFKNNAGLYKEAYGGKALKSISSKGETTVEEMKGLIETVLQFGIDFGLKDCFIEPEELKELLKYYE